MYKKIVLSLIVPFLEELIYMNHLNDSVDSFIMALINYADLN